MTADTKEPPSSAAYKLLREKDKQTLSSGIDCTSGSPDLHDILKTASEKAEESRSRKLKVRLPNGAIFIFRDVYSTIARWVSRFIEVGDVAVQYDPGHAALPWAAVRFLLKVAIGDLEKRAVVLEGLECVVRNLTWVAIHENLYLRESSQSVDALAKCLTEIYRNLFCFLAKVKRYHEKSKFARLASSALSTGGKFRRYLDSVTQSRQDVEVYSSQIARRTQVQQDDKLSNLLDALQSIGKPIERIENSGEAILKAVRSTERRELLDWVSTIPFQRHHAEVSRKALANTGGWLMKHQRYLQWHNSSRSEVLWLHGMAGSGKSVLLSMVTKAMLDAHNERHAPLPLYFYCSRTSQESNRSNPEEILRSLLRQASEVPGQDDVGFGLAERYDKRRIAGDLMMDESVDLLLSTVQDNLVTYIFIDALDECDRDLRYELITALERVLHESNSLIKLFVTSRDDQDIVLSMEHYPEISISANENQSDIDFYVSEEVDRLILNRRLLRTEKISAELKDLIKNRLQAGADGMFRWVELQLQYLTKIHTASVLRKRLGSLPKTLRDIYEELYRQNMSSIDQDEQALVKNFLTWLLVSERPLRSYEIVALVDPAPGQDSTIDVRTILALCFNLVEYDLQLDVFRFVHLSVREFLEEHAEFGLQHCRNMTALRAMKILCTPAVCSKEAHDYVLWYWPYHVQQAYGQAGMEQLTSLLKDFLIDEVEAFVTWATKLKKECQSSAFWSYDAKQRAVRHSLAQVPHQLLCAVQWNFQDLASEILEATDMDRLQEMRNIEGGGLINIAASYGRLEILSRLLNMGLSPSQAGGKMGLPLLAASSGGYTKSVDRLLQAGADISATDEVYFSALQAAAHHGHTDTVSLLLQHGAAAAISPTQQKNALQIASYHGFASIVDLLLSFGAANEHPGAIKPSRLLEVIDVSEQQSIQITIEEPADEDASLRNSPLIDPLLIAIRRGHSQIITTVLSGSRIVADGNTLEDLRQALISMLSVEGRQSLRDSVTAAPANLSLLKSASRVDLRDITYGLYKAALSENPTSSDELLSFIRDHPELLNVSQVAALLNTGVRFHNARLVSTCLELSAKLGHVVDSEKIRTLVGRFPGLDTVRVLVELNLHSGVSSEDTLSLVRTADIAGGIRIIEAILECNKELKKVSVEAVYKSIASGTHWYNRAALTQLLIDYGLDVSCVRYYASPLWWAFEAEAVADVRKMLEQGFSGDDEEFHDGKLFQACDRGDLEALQQLKTEKVRRCTEKAVNTSLMAAVDSGHRNVVRAICVGGFGWTIARNVFRRAFSRESLAERDPKMMDTLVELAEPYLPDVNIAAMIEHYPFHQ